MIDKNYHHHCKPCKDIERQSVISKMINYKTGKYTWPCVCGSHTDIFADRPRPISSYSYRKHRRCYISSAIRKKLGIDKHDTNIGIYVRKLLKTL